MILEWKKWVEVTFAARDYNTEDCGNIFKRFESSCFCSASDAIVPLFCVRTCQCIACTFIMRQYITCVYFPQHCFCVYSVAINCFLLPSSTCSLLVSMGMVMVSHAPNGADAVILRTLSFMV